jgi:hypothetical protein
MDFTSVNPWRPPIKCTYDAVGTSYQYNFTPWSSTLVPDKDPEYGIAGKREGWVRYPERYILVNESPAMPWSDDSGRWLYFFWHYARGPSTVTSLSGVRDRSISPVLFGDGHSVKYDFSWAIHSKPKYPTEEFPLWYWYEPAR